jgi:Fe-S-cluster containining protein
MNAICTGCAGKCCTSYTIELFQPQLSEAQFRDMLDWIGRHKDTFVEDIRVNQRLARIRVNNPCDYLDPDGKCNDYANRPLTCRLYKCEKLRG